MKFLIVVGARPNFIKIAPLIEEIKRHNQITRLSNHHRMTQLPNSPITQLPNDRMTYKLVHTGQHYDFELSKVFFQELKIPKPDYNLGTGSGSHAWQTAKIIKKLEPVILKEKPDLVIVVGDVNSTLAGALVAAKLRCSQLPNNLMTQFPLIAHIEAGLRSYDKSMPEEINRVLTDHISDFLFCPTKTAVSNLKREGFKNIINNGELIESSQLPNDPITQLPTVMNVGDIMYDTFKNQILKIKNKKHKSKIKTLQRLNLEPKQYFLLTLHRPVNVDNPENLKRILEAVRESGEKVVFPVHPRTRAKLGTGLVQNRSAASGSGPRTKKQLDNTTIQQYNNISFISPLGYIDMLCLEKNAKKILTDSGGVQKEAYWLKVPCITLRKETEWMETVKDGWNILVGCDKRKILRAIKHFKPKKKQSKYFGNGKTAERIVKIIREEFKHRQFDESF